MLLTERKTNKVKEEKTKDSKENVIGLPVEKGQFEILHDPIQKGRDIYHAMVPVTSMPFNISLSKNPRAHLIEGRVGREIEAGLVNQPDTFHILNRGVTILANKVTYDDKNKVLTMDEPFLIDGAHSVKIVEKIVSSLDQEEYAKKKGDIEQAYLHVEILTGIPEDVAIDIVKSRNTSAQLKAFSLTNLQGKFDFFKKEFQDAPFGNKIAYRENESLKDYPISILEIVSLLTLIHPEYASEDKSPVIGYSSRGKCLEFFESDEGYKGYKALRPIMVEFLKLYDYLQLSMPAFYRASGGASGVLGDKGKDVAVRLGRLSEVRRIKRGYPLHFLGEKAEFRFPDGWLYPILAAMRALIIYRGKELRFRTDPFEFLKKNGEKLFEVTLEKSHELNRSPSLVGKSSSHYEQLYHKVEQLYEKSLKKETRNGREEQPARKEETKEAKEGTRELVEA